MELESLGRSALRSVTDRAQAIRNSSIHSAPLPWHCPLVVAGMACLPLGLLWDISWHISIGRDTFWAPAHIVIQLGGLVPGLIFGWLAFKYTFYGSVEERTGSIRFLGAHAHLGAWVSIWGALAMLTSAPFDDWWHNTYGLDVKIASPPHSVLGLGMFAVALGVLLFVHSWQNRLPAVHRHNGAVLCALTAGIMITLFADFATEFSWPNRQHASTFYNVSCIHFPVLLVMTARATRLRWAATIAAASYMGIVMSIIWILPLFPAQPKLAPIYNPVDHMVPPAFPLLLILPAMAVDLVMHWMENKAPRNSRNANNADSNPEPVPLAPCQGEGNHESAAPSDSITASRIIARWFKGIVWKDWLLGLALGTLFLALFLAAQWFFSAFLLSEAADNRFFAGQRLWPYYIEPGDWVKRFWNLQDDPVNVKTIGIALLLSFASARIGLWSGNYLRSVKR